jgi:uncharacterized protein (UPF0297 family)
LLTSGCGQLGLGKAKNPVEQLVTLCKDENYKEAAKHMRSMGTDQSKKDQTANYESGDDKEKRQIEISCKQFKSLSEVKYTVGQERSEQGLSVYDVEIKQGSNKITQLWAFRKSGDDYVLVDID